MAALCGLTILLLCAPIMATTLPANMLNPATPTPSSSSSHSVSQTVTTQTQTPPPVTTVKATTEAQTPAQCFYTVTPIKFGVQINMIDNSTAGNYIVYLTEEGGPASKQEFNVHSSSQSSSHEIKHLKPCTTYQHRVVFNNDDGSDTPCNHTGNNTVTTDPMSEGDIKDGSSIPGSICFQSDWDISSSLPANAINEDHCTKETCCLKLDLEDICSDFTATFTSGNCVYSSFNLNRNIPVGLLDPSEIKQTVSPGLPATIEPTLPSHCTNLTVDYTCSEEGKVNDPKTLTELEPFTDYSCTGLIKDNNVSIDKRTSPIPVRINCSFTIDIESKPTSTSIELNWKTTSENCQDVLPELQNLSYDCSCELQSKSQIAGRLTKRPDGGKCSFTGLTVYTDHTCYIQPTYNNKAVGQRQRVNIRTKAGTPADIQKVIVDLPENNVIKVSCFYSRDGFFGPKKLYRARINAEDKPRESYRCEFEFRDLSYSTSYTVEVTAYNGEWESKPYRIDVSTKYNDKAVIASVCFSIIIFISVMVLVEIYIRKHRKSRSAVNDDMMLVSTAINVNARPPGWRHKAAR